MKAFYKTTLLCLFLVSFFATYVFAQSPDVSQETSGDAQTETNRNNKKTPPPAYLLPTITVNGSFDPEQGPTVPVSTPYGTQFNVVTEKQIKEQSSPDFLDTMRNVPGVVFSKHNMVGSNTGTSLYIRGRGYTHPSLETTTYFDGVPRYGLVYGQSMADGIPVSAIGSIEVYKYPQPSRFGTGYAFVNVTPKYRTTDGMELATGISGGSYKTFAENASFGFRKNRFDLYAAQSIASTQGHIVHSGAKQQSYYLNTGFHLSQHWNLRLLGNFVDAETKQPPYTGQSKKDILATYDTNTAFGTITLNNDYSKARGFFKLYINRTDFKLLDESARHEGDWSKQVLEATGAKARETFSFWKGNEIITGLDLDYTKSKNEQYVTGEADKITDFPNMRLISPYVAMSQSFNPSQKSRLIPSAGVRGYVHNVWANAVSPQAGLVAGYGNTDINFNYALGIIYPAPANIQTLVNSPNYSNADLKQVNPEIVYHFEAGITHNWPMLYGRDIGGSLGVSWFFDDGRDRIVMTSNVPGNASRVSYFRLTGIEASASLGIEKDRLFLKRFDLYGGGTWMAKIDARGEDGKSVDKMPYTPAISASAGFKWTFFERAKLSGDYQLLRDMYAGTLGRGQQTFTPLQDDKKLKDIHIINLRLSYGFEIRRIADVELYFALSNVLDRTYEYYIGYEMPGTTFMVGADFRFFI